MNSLNARGRHAGLTRTPLLLLSLATLLLASCASDTTSPAQQVVERAENFARRIDDCVDDPVRAEKMNAVLAEVSTQFQQRATQLQEAQAQLREAAKSYETSEADLQRGIDRIMLQGIELRTMLEEAHFEIRDLATREEWNQIAKPDGRFLGIF